MGRTDLDMAEAYHFLPPSRPKGTEMTMSGPAQPNSTRNESEMNGNGVCPPKTVNLDISKTKYGPRGVDGFFWPHDRTSTMPVRSVLFEGFMPAIRSHCLGGDMTALTARLFAKWFLIDAVRLYNAVSICRGFREREVIPVIPDRCTALAPLAAGRMPRSTLLSYLAKGQPRHDPLRSVKKMIRELQWNGLRFALPRRFNFDRDVFTCEPSPQTLAHARRAGKCLHYCSMGDWFEVIDRKVLDRPNAVAASSVLAALVGLVGKAFEAGGERPPEWLFEYFQNWFAGAVNFVSYHLEKLERKRAELPKRFWSGAVRSTVWLSMFSHAVRENRGWVVVHDHGTDNSHFDQSFIHFAAYAGCDEYYAPNRKSAEIKKRELNPAYFFSGKPPLITCPDDDLGMIYLAGVSPRKIRSEMKIKKLMYVPTAYKGDRGSLRPFLSDLVYLDWQARLFGFLETLNLEVVHQPHPEGQTRPPEDFAESFGFMTHRGRFEKCEEVVDAYVLDFIASSTTAPILKSNKPVIFVDLGFPALFPEARTLLERRCWYIPAWTDSQNRVHTDWEKLKQALQSDIHVFDTAFADLYLAGH